MAWTQPTAWQAGDPLTADRLNTEIKDNLLALKNPPSVNFNVTTNYATTSSAWVDVDSTNLSLTIVTTGGDILIGFHGYLNLGGDSATNGYAYMDVALDGTRLAGGSGIIQVRQDFGGHQFVSFVRLVTGLSAGSHTLKLQWRYATSVTNTLTLYGSSTRPQFWVREVS